METRTFTLSSYDISPSDNLADYYNKTVSSQYGTVADNRMSLTWNNVNIQQIVGNDFYNAYNQFSIKLMNYTLNSAPTSSGSSTIQQLWQDAFANVYLNGLPFYPPMPNGALMNVINISPLSALTGASSGINFNSSLSWTFLKTSTANLGINIRSVATEQPYSPGDIMTNMRGHSVYTFEITGLTDVSNVSYVDLSNGSVLNSGAHTIYADLTPNDQNNYFRSLSISTIMVTPSASSIAFSPSIPSYIVYETDLSNVLVSEQSDAGTTRYYLDADFMNEVTKTSVLNYGSYTIYAVFTPSGGDYSSSSTSTSLIVTQKSTSIVYTTPSSIVYGTMISSSLTATCTVSGEIAYFYDASFSQAVQTTDVKNFGTHTIYAKFTPATNNYLPSSTSVSLSVTKALTILTYNALSAITYGTTIGASLNATSYIVEGTTNYYLDSAYTQLLSSTAVLNASTYTIYAVFTPSSSNYSPSYASSSITVNKLQTTITFPNTSSFIYETTMSAFISGTTAGGVAGTFAFSQNGNTLTSASVLSVGTYTIDATFTPSDLSNNLSSSNSKSLTVTTLSTSVAFSGSIPSSVVYNTGLASVLSVVVTPNVAGSTSYHYVNASSQNVSVTTTTVLPVGSYTIHATFTPSTGDYAGSSTSTALTVTQATPTVTYSGLSGIVYQTTLAASLSASISPSIDGSFNYYIGSTEVFPTTVLNVGSYTINAIFTSRNANYTTASQQTGLTVGKFTPTINYNIIAPIVYGTTIASSLTATSDVSGTFAYSIDGNALSSTDILNAGTYTIFATFTPSSTSNYESETITSSITVDKRPTSITFPATSSIVYETTMSSFISGTTVSNGVAGTFAFSANDIEVIASSALRVGTYTISCTFTPSDTSNNLSSSNTKSLSVSTKSTTLAFASSIPSSIVYGNTLSQVSVMVITPDVSGTLRFYKDSNHTEEVQTTTVLDAGAYTIYSTFTPTNSDDYTSSSASTNLTVTKATTAVTYPTLSNIVYGTTLSSSFSAYVTPSMFGAFSYYYMDGATKVSLIATDLLNVGSHTIYVDFTPSSSNYTGSSNNQSLTVTAASTTVIYDTPSDIIYTATLASSLTATAYPNIAGSMKYYINEAEVTSATILTVGSYSISATFTPTSSNYTASTTTKSLTVNKKSTTITFPNISTIIYTKTLSTFIGGTTTGVAGTYSFFENDLNGNALSSSTGLELGSYTIFCRFVPTDSANYLSSQSTTTISVTLMSTSLSFSTSIPSSIVYETTLTSVLVTNLVSNVDGTTSYRISGTDVSAGTILNVGTYTIVATFTPSDTDYAQSSVSTTISVTQSATTLSFIIPSSIVYGTTLNSSLTATCAKAGTISYFYDGSHTLVASGNDALNAGTYTIYALFTPTSTNYLSSAASASLTVTKSATTITFGSGVPSVLTYETTVANVLNTQVSPSVAGTAAYYYYSASTRIDLSSNDVLVVGSYTIYADFVPTDSANYSSSTVTMALLVSQKTITVIFSGLSAITYGQTLATSLTASLGQTVDGSMNYYTDSLYNVQVTSATTLNAGSYTIYARFTPSSGNYVAYPVSTSLVVNKFVPTVIYTIPSSTIVYGTQLQSSFTASVSPTVSGSFKYYYLNDELSSTQILNVGTYAIRAAFTSSDPNYADASTTANLTVSQQTPSITFGVSSFAYETTFQTFISGTTASTAGTFAFSNATSGVLLASSVLAAGVYTINCTFTPTDTTNYTIKTASSTLYVKLITVLSNFTIPAKPVGSGNLYIVNPTSNRPGISYFSYTSSNTSVATVTGSLISVVGIGTSTITATQASSDSYLSGTATTVFQVYGVGTYTENGINYIYHIGLGTAEVSGVTAAGKLLSTATILSSFVVGGTTYTVTIIGYGAFYGWTNLTNLSLPSSITTLEGSAFSGCINLTNIDLPSTITTIGSVCFYDCRKLLSFTIPPLVTTLEIRTFRDCVSLTSIIIPSTVTTVKTGFDGGSSTAPFVGCTGLVNIVVNTNIPAYRAVFPINNPNMSVTFNYPGVIPAACLEFRTGLKTVIIGNQITGIGNSAFYSCTGLTSVTFGSSLTTIGNGSFRSCTNLNNIVIPPSVTTILYGAFESCTSFTSVTIPSTVTTVEPGLFINCTNLTNVVVNANLGALVYTFASINSVNMTITFDYPASVPTNVCANVTNLKTVILSNLITGIDSAAFSGCTGLTEIIIPASVTTIANNSFFGCNNLNSVSFFGNIPTIGSNNFTSTTDSAFYKADETTNTNATTVSTRLSMFTNKAAITAGTPTITDFSVPMKKYNSLPFSIVDPSSNSGGDFTYTSSNTSVATVSGKMITVIASGTTTITATQSANYKYGVNYSSGTITTTFVVDNPPPQLGSLVITNKSLSDVSFLMVNPTQPNNSTGTWTYTSSDLTKATVSGNTVTLLDVGIVTITGTISSDSNYSSSTVVAVFSISPADVVPSTFTFVSSNAVSNAITTTVQPVATTVVVSSENFTPEELQTLNPSEGTLVEKIENRDTLVDSLFNIFSNADTVSIPQTAFYMPPTIDSSNISQVTVFKTTGTTSQSPLVINASTINSTTSFFCPIDEVNNSVLFNGTSTFASYSVKITRASDTNYTIVQTKQGVATTYTAVKDDIIYYAGFKLVIGSIAGQLSPLQLVVLTNFSIPVKTLADTTFTITPPTTTSNGAFTYTSSNTEIATISGDIVTIVGLGNATITAVQARTSTHLSDTITTTLTVNKIVTVLTNFVVPVKTVVDASFGIIAPTSNSSGTFTYTSSNTAVATISGDIITIIAAGTSTVTAVQSTTSTHATQTTTTTFTVNKVTTVITNFSVPTKTFGDASFNITTPTTNSDGVITYTSSNTAVATIVGSMITIVGAGTSTITASQATNAIYTSGTTTTTFTVSQITAVLTNFSVPVKTFGNANFSIVTPTSNSSGLITYTSSNTSVATIVGSTITIVGGGTSTITAVQASTTNYTSGTITTSLTVNQAAPTITNFSTPIKTFGDASFNIIPPTTNSSGLITYTSSDTAVATIVGGTITIVGVGNTTITAVQASTDNYTTGTITTSFSVNKAAPTITNFSVPTKAFGDVSFSIITPTTNSSGLITYTSSNTAVATIVGSTITIIGVGTSTITASQATTSNFLAATVTTTLTVNKATTTITNFAIPEKTFGDASFSIITPTSNSSGSITYTSSNTAVATIVGSTITIVGGGTTTITASQVTTANFLAATVTATLTVNQTTAVMTNFAVPTKTFGDAYFEIVAPTSTSNGLITYTSSNTAVATIVGSTITIVGFGTSTITAVQASTSNFLAATITAVFQVNNVPPTITNFTVPAKTFEDVSFNLVAPTSNSAGDFTYTSSNVSVATIVGSRITIIGAGTTSITANQSSTPSFAAGSISTTFTVNPTTSVLTSFSVPVKTFGNAAFSISPPTSSGSGLFTYTSTATSVATIAGNMITIVGTGSSIITATFTPSTANYTTASISSTLVVNKASTSVSYPALQSVLYSEQLGNTRLNATVSPVIAGTMDYFRDSAFTTQIFSTTTLSQGSYTLYARFTPTSSNYIGSFGVTALTVFQLIPTSITFPNVTTIPVYTTLESFINGTTTGIPGTYVFRKNNSTGPILTATSTFDTLGNFLVYCSFTPTSDLYSGSFSSYIAKVKFTPTILFTQRPSSTISYGTNLTGSVLSTTVSQFNNTSIAGTITYSNSTTTNTILLPGLYTVTATFTPTNLSLFNVATTSKQILVNKQQFSITITSPSVKSAFIKSTPIDCSYQVLGILSALGDTFANSVVGTIVNRYTNMDETTILTSEYVYNTTFSGSSQTYKIAADIYGFSSTKYDFVPQSYTFTMNKYTPTINYTVQTANKTLTYGTKLSTSQLNAVVSYGGNAVTSGSVVYTRSAINLALTVDTQTVLDVGQHYLYAYFSDPISNLYNSVDTSTVTTNRITIDKATPTFSFPNISSILSGSTLADILNFVVAVSNGSDVAGTFAFTYVNGSGATVSLTPTTVVTSPPSTITITATFTPSDTTRYNVSTGTKSVKISDQSSSISTTALLSSPIVYGKTFNEIYSINVSPSGLAGTFAYYDDVYTFDPTQVIDAGSYNYTVIFNPSSSAYASSLVEVAFTVTNATMTIAYASPPSYQYQTANQLSLLQPAKSVAVDGVMQIFLDSAFTTPLTSMAVGTHTIYARFTPVKNYNVATTTTTLTVTKIPTSLLYVTQTSSITFGETNASFLNNSVVNSIQGTIQYYYDISFTQIANPTDVLEYGTQTIYYRFVPTDSNYAMSYATHTVNVNKNVLTISYSALNPIQYGTTLASSLSASSTFDGSINYFINGTQVYESTQLNGGSYTITAILTSSNPTNFTTSTVSTTRTLIVTKQATVITYVPPSNIVSGATFAASMTATISPNIAGTMRYFTNNEEILNSTVLTTGNYIVSVTFTPTNLTNYTSSLVTVPITVITGAQLVTFNENIQQIQTASNNQVVSIVSQNQLLPSTLSVKVNTLTANQTTFTPAITTTTAITSLQFNFLDGSIGSNVKVAVSALTVNLPGAANSPAIYFKFYDENGNSVINGNNRVSLELNLPQYKGLIKDLYLLRMQDVGTDFDGTKIPLTSVNPTDSQNSTFTAIFTSNSVYVGAIIPSATNELTDGPLLSNVYTFQASGGFIMQRGFDDLKLRDYTVVETYDVTDSVQVLFDVALFNAKLGITKNGANTQIISSMFNPVTDQFENNGELVNTVSFTASEFIDGVTKSQQIISVGKYSNVYNDFKNYVSTYFGYDGGFSSLFTAASEFTIDDNNTFDSSSMLQLFTGVTSTSSAYINEMTGSFSVADIVKSLRYSVNTNCFGNRNPTISGVAVDPANSSNYGVADGFVAGDLIWINSGTTLNLNLNIDTESFAPLNNSGPEYVSQITNTSTLNFSQTTTASTTNINRTVRAPLLIKLVNASTIDSL